MTETVLLPIPERIQASDTFIRAAIELSRLYQLDIRITRHSSQLCVEYSFDCGLFPREMGQLFSMADELSFFPDIRGRAITVCLDYHTHKTVRKGSLPD